MVRSGALSSRSVNNKFLLDSQELAICEYIDRLESWEMPFRPAMIETAAKYLLPPNGTERAVGDRWAQRFLDRHPDYFPQTKKKRQLGVPGHDYSPLSVGPAANSSHDKELQNPNP